MAEGMAAFQRERRESFRSGFTCLNVCREHLADMLSAAPAKGSRFAVNFGQKRTW